MSVRTPNNLFIGSSLELHAGFYQRVLKEASDFKELGNKLVQAAEYERAFRRYDRVNEIAQLLINLPLKEHHLIGQYYLGLCEYSKGIYAVDIFENIAEKSSTKYRLLAMHSLASIERRRGDYDTELAWLLETLKIAPSIQALRGIAILKAIEGNHKAAVKDFETYLPLIRHAGPLPYYDFLNSYAVELGEVGRIYEARNISEIVIHSPFAFAYPEWQDTANDLRGSSRSFVAFAPSRYVPHNVLPMPVREHEVKTQQKSKRARVMSLQKWREKMAKDKTDEPKLTDTRDILMWIMNTYTDEGTTRHQRYKIYEAVMKIMAEGNNPKPDDDTPGA